MTSELKDFEELDWFTKDGRIAIKEGIAMIDLPQGIELVSYGKIGGEIKYDLS